MKKLNSLAFKMPLSISCISSIIIIILLVISLFFSSKGITESINVGFRNTVEGYAYLLDALTEAQMLLANSYASDANIRNYMIFRDDVYSVYSGRDMTNFIEKNSYAESIYLTDINGNVLLTTSEALRNRNMADIRPDLWRKLSTGEKVAYINEQGILILKEVSFRKVMFELAYEMKGRNRCCYCCRWPPWLSAARPMVQRLPLARRASF